MPVVADHFPPRLGAGIEPVLDVGAVAAIDDPDGYFSSTCFGIWGQRDGCVCDRTSRSSAKVGCFSSSTTTVGVEPCEVMG